METDRENAIIRQRNDEIPTRTLDTAIFTDASTVASAQIHLYYNSNIGKIIMSLNGKNTPLIYTMITTYEHYFLFYSLVNDCLTE